MRRFYAAPDQLTQNKIELGLEESKHLRDVLRLREGDEVSVFDGEGKEYTCKVEKIGRGKEACKLTVTSEIKPPAPESKLDLTLAIALLKGEKLDLVIQKATELGVTKIVPLETKRADVKTGKTDSSKKLERWNRIALEAAKQCGRARVPAIAEPAEFAEFIKAQDGMKLFFSEREGQSLSGFISNNAKPDRVIAVVGSEGGWEDTEIAQARGQGFHIITLGGRVLRAETAGIAVSALLQNLFGDLN
jgi:16S rRNA (uracil1498-N3)-methyltransferase